MSAISSDTNQMEEKSGNTFIKSIVSVMPWAVVGGLLYAGLFVKPTVEIEKVDEPAIERRDRIYGLDVLRDEQTIWLVGNYGKILKSSDHTKGWEKQISHTRNHLQDISSWDADRAVVVGNKGIVLVTENGGENWNNIEVPKSEIADKIIRVHTYPGGLGLAVGEYGKILLTQDYGQSWKQIREEEDVILNDAILIDDTKVIVVGEYGRILLSEDLGDTWSEIENETGSLSSLTAIDFMDAENGVAVGLDGKIITTSDGGLIWANVDTQYKKITDHLMDVSWNETTHTWFIVGNKGRWVTANRFLDDIQTGIFNDIDLSWHTEAVKLNGHYFVVGANVGTYDLASNKLTMTSNQLIK